MFAEIKYKIQRRICKMCYQFYSARILITETMPCHLVKQQQLAQFNSFTGSIKNIQGNDLESICSIVKIVTKLNDNI